MKGITYVVPVYGKPGMLATCLSSLRKHEPLAPIIVVDDCGPDTFEIEGVAKLYNAKYHHCDENGGFATAVNIGVRLAETETVCLVNSDLLFTHPVGDLIAESLEMGDIVGAMLLYPDGKIEHGGGFYHYFGVKHYGEFRYPYQARLCTIPAYRFFVTAALMAFDKLTWTALYGFNEDYKNDSEDADFCVRAWTLGFKVLYNPEIRAIHYKSQTLNDRPDLMGGRIESNKKFKEFLASQDIEKIERKINELNGEMHPDLPRAFVRTNAMGDVLRTLELYRKINRAMVVVTNFPEVYQAEDVVAVTPFRDEWEVSQIIDLDLTYERRPQLSIEASYEKFFQENFTWNFSPTDYENWKNHPVDFLATEYDWLRVRMLSKHNWDLPFVVIHGRTGNPNRSMRPEFWGAVADRLISAGYYVVIIGSATDTQLTGGKIVNLVDRMDLRMTRALLEHASAFVGSDSGPLHLADGACPAVGIFTIARPETRVSTAVKAFETPAPCKGCLHRQKPPLTNFTCEFPENDPQRFFCTEVINPQAVAEMVIQEARR
jgi:GT2 family glycosyltransferase